MQGTPIRSGAITFTRNGTRLNGSVRGAGRPVLFVHGLGGAVDQADELVSAIPGYRWLMPDIRGHGGSEPGAERPVSIPLLADDVSAFARQCGASRVVAGGISLGAAVALHLAVHHRPLVDALVLVRPAWLFAPAPESLGWFRLLAPALRASRANEGRAAFASSAAFRAMAERAPSHAAALLRWFDHPHPAAAADLLNGVLAGDPGVTAREAAALDVPVLVLASPDELPHPLATAKALADALPRSRLVVLPSRVPDKSRALRSARAAIARFLAGLPRAKGEVTSESSMDRPSG